MNDHLTKKLAPKEVGSLMQNPTGTEGAAGNNLHDHLQQFQGQDAEVQFRKIWKSAGFMRRVSVGMRSGTIQDVNDGFGDRTRSCRESTLPRDDPDTEIKFWIKGNTEIGPILEVKAICHLDVHLVMVPILGLCCPEANRYVDELRYNDPDYSAECFEEADCESIEETHAEQPTTQSTTQCRQSEDHIPIDKREWIDLTANEKKSYVSVGNPYLEFVMRLVRHVDLQERESDGAVHWTSIGRKLRYAFLKHGGDTFSVNEWINNISKGSSKNTIPKLQELLQ